MNKKIFLFLSLLTLTLSAANAKVEVLRPWIRATNGPNAAVFMRIVNKSPNVVHLVSAHTQAANLTELHQNNETEDGTNKMEKITNLVIPKEGNVALEPGGKHIMLVGTNRPLKDGDNVHLILGFSDGESVNVVVPVRKHANEGETLKD